MSVQLSLHTPQAAPPGYEFPVWTQPAFMNAIAGLHQLKALHLYCHKGDTLAAVLPVYERSRLGIRHLVCPVLAYYQPLSLFVNPGTLSPRQNWDKLQISTSLAEFIGKSYRKVHFNLDPDTFDIRAFSWSGFRASPLYTYIHEANSQPRATRNEQRKLKTASTQGYCYDENFAPQEFIALLKLLYAKKKHKLGFSYPRLLVFLHDLHSAGLLHQCNLRRDDKIVSSNIVFGSGSGTAYAVLGASLEQELQYGASSLQTLEMLESLHESYTRVDFCGANVAEVARFKAGLGFDLRLFFRIEGKSGLR